MLDDVQIEHKKISRNKIIMKDEEALICISSW